jgi:hypothetical protein
MEVWQTHCPRLSIWEDALSAGLVRSYSACVELTELGKAALDGVEVGDSESSRAHAGVEAP